MWGVWVRVVRSNRNVCGRAVVVMRNYTEAESPGKDPQRLRLSTQSNPPNRLLDFFLFSYFFFAQCIKPRRFALCKEPFCGAVSMSFRKMKRAGQFTSLSTVMYLTS